MDSLEIKEVRIPVDALKAQPLELRHTYYLLGHVFNELIALQKMIHYAFPKHDDSSRFRRNAEVGQAVFLFRIACSKVYEAKIAFNGKQVAATLKNSVWPHLQDGSKRLKALNQLVDSKPWVSRLRNKLGFHYPAMKDWQSQIEPDDSWEDDLVFVGEQTGNTFYDSANVVLQGFQFDLGGGSDIALVIDSSISEMIELLRAATSFLEDVLGVLIADVLLDGKCETTSVGAIAAPAFDQVFLPYWTAMPKAPD